MQQAGQGYLMQVGSIRKCAPALPSDFINNSHIWPPLVAIFLALWVWEGTGAIQDDKDLKW